ncbi:bZIP transcription factor domain-containing protein [Sarocladium implicatum]|nr:bZIP transcription factor domain-containing protein [Sarocladium implicatum]
MMPLAPPHDHNPGISAGSAAAHIAPAPPGSLPLEDPSGDGRKAKRELSQSKRAAQNRAAQRAFRQRKEGYIKKLEQQVREYAEIEESIKSTQNENEALRDYVAHLQSRLLEVHGDYPQPPPGLSLAHTASAAIAEQAPMDTGDVPPDHGVDNTATDGGSTLEAEAVAVAGLAAQEQMAAEVDRYPSPGYRADSGGEDTRSADEINRHLGASETSGAGQPQAV